MVVGDFNGKVGCNKEMDIVGPFGLGERSGNGERVINLCRGHGMFVTNTWFEQKKSARYTWCDSQNKSVKNQIDYVLVDKRY